MKTNNTKIIKFFLNDLSPAMATEIDIKTNDAEYKNKDHLDIAILDAEDNGATDIVAIEANDVPAWLSIIHSRIETSEDGTSYDNRFWHPGRNNTFHSPPLPSEGLLHYELKLNTENKHTAAFTITKSAEARFTVSVPLKWALSLLYTDPNTIFKKNEHHR